MLECKNGALTQLGQTPLLIVAGISLTMPIKEFQAELVIH